MPFVSHSISQLNKKKRGTTKIAPPLDSSVAAFEAHSLNRLLITSYAGQPKFRIRRSSDNTEHDCSSDDRDSLKSEVLTFCGSGSGYLVKVYDQTGNSRIRNDATMANQPRVCNTGTLELSGVYLVANFYTTTSRLPDPGTGNFDNTHTYNFANVYLNTDVSTSYLYENGTNQYAYAADSTDTTSALHGQLDVTPSTYKNGSTVTVSTRADMSSTFYTGSNVVHGIYNISTQSTWGARMYFGGAGIVLAGFEWRGLYMEEIIFDYTATSQSTSDLVNVMTNQKSYYGI